MSSSLSFPDDQKSPHHSPPTTPIPTATAKPDFSLFTQTIGRQLHNVASFLAPPPPQPYSPSTPLPLPDDSGDVSPSSTSSYQGIKNDLAEIGSSFKTSLYLLSPKKAVNEISKFASNLLQSDKGDGDLDVVGITDDVLDFVREISNRPQYWIDFPLSLQHQDFSISHVQKDHALAIQQLVPNLATLKHTIHSHMSEEQFWMIYFILLLPRLNENHYRLLSTPKIIQVREVLLEKLKSKNTATGFSEDDTHNENRSSSEKGSQVDNIKRIKNPSQESESSGETGKARNRKKQEKQHEDDVSFSDLEDYECNDVSGSSSVNKQTQSSRHSSASENSDWVRLSETSKANRSIYRERHSESGESSDWHNVDDSDL